MWSQYAGLADCLNNLIDAIKNTSFASFTFSANVILLLSREESIAVEKSKNHGSSEPSAPSVIKRCYAWYAVVSIGP